MPGRRHAGFLASHEPWLPSGNRCQGCDDPTRPTSPRPADRGRTNDAGTSRRRRPPIGLPSDTVFRLSVTAAHPLPLIPDPFVRLDAFQFRARGLINAANHPSTRAAGLDWVGRGYKHTRVTWHRCVSVRGHADNPGYKAAWKVGDEKRGKGVYVRSRGGTQECKLWDGRVI